MNWFRRFSALLLMIAFCFSRAPAALAAEEDPSSPREETANPPAAFRVVYSGEIRPEGTLELSTEPELENVIYAVRSDPEAPWLVLEGSRYTIPAGEPGSYRLWITAVWEDMLAENMPVLTYTIEAPSGDGSTPETQPEETQPKETQPEETQPEETQPKETQPEETQPKETQPEETQPEETHPEETRPETDTNGPDLYFGQLHAHTALSGGAGTVEEAFQYAAKVPGLDFFAVTDHSHTFDYSDQGSIAQDAAAVSADWAEGKAAAQAVTDASFVGIFGYEMSWHAAAHRGHITTFHTPGFQTRDQEAFRHTATALENYYAALASQSGAVGQFSHPGNRYGTFDGFAYSEAADGVISLLEVVCGEERFDMAYIRALEQGWHVAPTCNQANYNGRWGDESEGRTVIYARSLTEADLCDAMRARRVYATEDRDLEILYSLDGHFMGSVLSRRQAGRTADISVTLRDPTDEAVGLVEVITCGGERVAGVEAESGSETVTFSLPPDKPYYFLRITQPDGDVAVTAPVWIEQQERLGIRNLTCETAVPVQNQPVTLAMEVYNEETSPLELESLRILSGGQLLLEENVRTSLAGGAEWNHTVSFSCDVIGRTPVQITLTGTIDGEARILESEITLVFRRSQPVSRVLLDGTHGNSGLEELSALRALTEEAGIRLTTEAEAFSADDLKTARLLIVTAPAEPFAPEFVETVADFAAYGGSVLICGQSDDPEGNESLNELLGALGSGMRLGANIPEGDGSSLLTDFATASVWCAGVHPGQKYRLSSGCAVEAPQGGWLVRTGQEGAAVLAWEETEAEGAVFAAGSLFFRDECLAEPDSIWAPPSANRTILRSILGMAVEPLPLSVICQTGGDPEQLLRIRGYVTAGTDNPHTAFPDTLYLQDDTGAVAVTPFTAAGMEPGTALEITGYAQTAGGNRTLTPVEVRLLEAAPCLYPAQTGSWDTLLEGEAQSGVFVQLEGTCGEIRLRSDGTLARFALEGDGRRAEIVIGDGIFAGSDGTNDLHERVLPGRKIRVRGFVHREESGETVLLVRNCEEVDYVPPLTDIPRTGDRGHIAFGISGAALAALGALAAGRKGRQ